MISAFKSPVDLFFLTDLDTPEFQRHSFNSRAVIQQYSMIADVESDRSGDDNMSKNIFLDEDRILNKSRKDHLSRRLSDVRRYYAYRKSLLKLDFVQGNNDPEEVLKRIKKSAIWSRLDDSELKRGLKSHMDLLKEHTSRFGCGSSSSLADYENVALERINSEMGSELAEVLYYPDPDEWLMHAYFHRMKLKSLARECAMLAENTGITLVKEFMPVPVKEHTVLPSLKQAVEHSVNFPSLKQAVKHSVNGWMDYMRGGGTIRGKSSWQVLGLGILGAAAAFGMNEPEH